MTTGIDIEFEDSGGDLTIELAPPLRTAGIPFSGTDARNEIRWKDARWQAVNTDTTRWSAITRANTYDALSSLLTDPAVLARGGYGRNTDGDGGVQRRGSAISIHKTGARSNSYGTPLVELADIWPAAGPAPYVWVISPEYYGWIGQFTIEGRLDRGPPIATFNDVALVIPAWRIEINGVPYDVAYKSLDGVVARPDPDQGDRAIVFFPYTAPPASGRVVTRVQIPRS